MSNTEGDNQNPNKSSKNSERDAYDWATLGTAIIGVIVVVVATVLTQISQCSTDTQVASLITNTSKLAISAKQQANDTAKLRKATEDFAAAMKTQSENTGKLVDQTKASAGFAQQSATAVNGQLRVMREESAPDVELSSAQGGPHLISTSNQPNVTVVGWSFTFKNVGKTAALQFQERPFLRLNGGPKVPSEGTLIWSAPTRLAPGQDSYTTAFYPGATTQEDFKRMLSRDNGIMLIAEIKFRDSTGKRYSDSICFTHYMNSSIGYYPGRICDHIVPK